MGEQMEVPIAKAVQGFVAPDGKHLGLIFDTVDGGRVAVALPERELGATVAYLVQVIAQAAAEAPTAGDEPASAVAVHGASLRLSPGASPSEALVTLRVGLLALNFALGLREVLEQCQQGIELMAQAKAPRN